MLKTCFSILERISPKIVPEIFLLADFECFLILIFDLGQQGGCNAVVHLVVPRGGRKVS